MEVSRSLARLRDLILKSGQVDELQMRSAMAKLEQWGGRLPNVLVELGFVDEDAITALLGKSLRLPVMHLGNVSKDGAALSKLDATYCELHAVFPVSLRNRVLTLAMSDPTDITCIDEVGMQVKARVVPVVASESEVMGAISRHYHGRERKDPNTRMRQLVTAELPPPSGADLGGIELDTSTPPPPPGMTYSSPRRTTSSANTLLDEMLGGEEKSGGDFSPGDLKRVHAAVQNQKKTAAILQALTELLTEKGLL